MAPAAKPKGTAPEPKTEPESFSPASARLSAEALLQALPKSLLPEYLGALNEILVTINRLCQEAGIKDEAKGL